MEDTPDVTVNPEEDGKTEESPATIKSTDALDLRRTQRETRPPIRYGYEEYADHAQHSALCVYKVTEPQTLSEALNSEYCSRWKCC